MVRSAAAICVVLGCLSAFAQSPGSNDYSNLIKNSLVLASGVAEEESWVVDRDKYAAAMHRPQLPNPAEFIVGRIIRLRIDEIVKGAKVAKAGSTINVFLPGSVASENSPAFVKGKRYLLLLSYLKTPASNFKDTGIYQPFAPSSKLLPFDPKQYFSVVGDSFGALPYDIEHQATIANIKAMARRH
jgi:hypothetical protein